jgi:hypothetical protein
MISRSPVAVGALTTVLALSVAATAAGPARFDGAFPFAGYDSTVDIALAGIAATTPLDGSPRSLAVGPDGSLYFSTGSTLRRVRRDGWITSIAGFRPYAPRDVAVARDGSLFVFDEHSNKVVRLNSKTKTVVAGSGADCSSTVESTDATGVALCGVDAVDVDGQGRLLIADSWPPARIRRVNADGTIETVAGGGTGDGTSGPATAARLGEPADVAALPSGGFLIADSQRNRVFEVDAGGEIRVVAGGRSGPRNTARSLRLSPASVAALPGGGFLVTANDRLIRVGNDDRFAYLGGLPKYPPAGLGGPLPQARFYASDVAVARDGAVFVATGDRVLLLPRRGSARPAVTFDGSSARSAHLYTLRFRARATGTVSISPVSGRRNMKDIRARARPGVNSVHLPSSLGSDAYTFVLTLSHGKTDVGDVAKFLTGPRLTSKEAALLIDSDRKEVDAARVSEGVDTYSRGKCRSMSTTRADCQIELTPYLEGTYCDHNAAVVLARSGVVSIRDYVGCKFALNPKWYARAHPAPALTPY